MRTQQEMPFDHSGPSLDSFVEEEGILDEVEASANKRVSDWQAEKVAVEGRLRNRSDEVSSQSRAQPAEGYSCKSPRKMSS